MTDMTQVIKPKSDQINADDLIAGDMTVKITRVDVRGGQEQPVSIHFEGDNGKPYKPCKSMCRVLVFIWGADAKEYVGKSMTMYRDAKVTWGGMEVGGIRISHMSHMDKPVTMALTASKSKRAMHTVNPLKVSEPTPIDPAVRTAGDDAASRGVAAYTEWLSTLDPTVKATVKPHHADWSARAKKADEDAKEAF
jgi:hypothetical protein